MLVCLLLLLDLFYRSPHANFGMVLNILLFSDEKIFTTSKGHCAQASCKEQSMFTQSQKVAQNTQDESKWNVQGKISAHRQTHGKTSNLTAKKINAATLEIFKYNKTCWCAKQSSRDFFIHPSTEELQRGTDCTATKIGQLMDVSRELWSSRSWGRPLISAEAEAEWDLPLSHWRVQLYDFRDWKDSRLTRDHLSQLFFFVRNLFANCPQIKSHDLASPLIASLGQSNDSCGRKQATNRRRIRGI